MTSLDADSFHVNSIGNQAQSARKTAPSAGISKVGRESYDKVFISKDHMRTQHIGRQSPTGGAIYEYKSTLDLKHGVSFAAGKRPDLYDIPGNCRGRDDPGDLPSGDMLCCLPDSQPFRYRRDPEIIIGTDPRGKLKDATLLKNHSAAFFGRESPGPAAIGDTYGPEWKGTRKTVAPAGRFGVKIPRPDWQQIHDPQVCKDVGPGRYSRRDVSIGKQHLTHRHNQAVHEFPHAPKFAKTRNADSISKLDAARTAFGKQVLNKNRSEPSIQFNADTRDIRGRTALCMTKLDVGPKATMPKPRFSMPGLPSEKAVMACGYG